MEVALRILTCVGVWKPAGWHNTSTGRLYDLARVFLLPMPSFLVIGQLLHLAFETENLDEAIETLYLLPSSLVISCKALNVFLMRRRIAEIFVDLKSDFSKAKDEQEEKIIDQANRFLRKLCGTYVWLVEAIVLTSLTSPLLQTTTESKKHPLAVEVWLPYDYTSSRWLYWLTYTSTGLIATVTANAGAGTDLNFVGLLISTRLQLELLSHRLAKLPEYSRRGDCRSEAVLLDRHVRHHVFIYSLAKKLIDAFRATILVQWIISSSLVSMSVYQMSLDTSLSSLNFYSKLSYVTVVLTQLLLLCWFSEQISVKSREVGTAILDIDWTLLQPSTIKSYLLISTRSAKPIVISCGYFFAFSLDTFKAILKVSYSAFSILRDSSAVG